MYACAVDRLDVENLRHVSLANWTVLLHTAMCTNLRRHTAVHHGYIMMPALASSTISDAASAHIVPNTDQLTGKPT